MPSKPHLPTLQDDNASGRPRISRKVSAAIDAMLNGEAKTITAAAETVGLARETLSRALSRPHVQAEMQARVDKLLKGASVVRAAAVLGHLLDAGSEHVRLKAAELVLAINGHRPPPANVTVNNNVGAVGWVIDLREDKDAPAYIAGNGQSLTFMNGERAERLMQQQTQIIDITATTIEEDTP